MISATCHCGAVRLGIPAAPEAATLCNCSICRRLGALWGYFPAAEVQIDAAPGAVQEYLWGDRTLRFAHCTRCGCTTHVLPVTPGRKTEVNLRMFDPAQLGPFRIRLFDGADTWKYVGEIPAPTAF